MSDIQPIHRTANHSVYLAIRLSVHTPAKHVAFFRHQPKSPSMAPCPIKRWTHINGPVIQGRSENLWCATTQTGVLFYYRPPRRKKKKARQREAGFSEKIPGKNKILRRKHVETKANIYERDKRRAHKDGMQPQSKQTVTSVRRSRALKVRSHPLGFKESDRVRNTTRGESNGLKNK